MIFMTSRVIKKTPLVSTRRTSRGWRPRWTRRGEQARTAHMLSHTEGVHFQPRAYKSSARAGDGEQRQELSHQYQRNPRNCLQMT